MFSGFQSNAFQNNAFQIIPGGASPVAVTGGHYIPPHGKHKRTLSNILVLYNKAMDLPRAETKELRDAISEFVEPEIARNTYVPDIFKVDYEALAANEAAYLKFEQALLNIQKRLEIAATEEDEELLLMAIIACSIN